MQMSEHTKKLAVSAAIFFVVWNLIDFVFDVVLAGGPFEFNIFANIITPAVISVAVDLLQEYVFDKKKNRRKPPVE